MICGKIVPRQEEVLRKLNAQCDGNYLAKCVLPSRHVGGCVFCLPNGKYIMWENEECDHCPLTHAEEPINCGEITPEQFKKLSCGES